MGTYVFDTMKSLSFSWRVEVDTPQKISTVKNVKILNDFDAMTSASESR